MFSPSQIKTEDNNLTHSSLLQRFSNFATVPPDLLICAN
uniref:Uncharacterized protein n=1 Tax=Anguilla anguilla TaxID=7936 RepID=A0A0E9W3H2_ANGAN